MKIAERIHMLYNRNKTRKSICGPALTPNETLICGAVDQAVEPLEERVKALEERVGTLLIVQRPLP